MDTTNPTPGEDVVPAPAPAPEPEAQPEAVPAATE